MTIVNWGKYYKSDVVPKGPAGADINLAFKQEMAWPQTNDEPLTQPMLTNLTTRYRCDQIASFLLCHKNKQDSQKHPIPN